MMPPGNGLRDLLEVGPQFVAGICQAVVRRNCGPLSLDIRLLELLVSARGRPMGLSTMAAALSEDEGTIEDVVEPYLIANGYIERTARGRVATEKSYIHFRLTSPQSDRLL
jgi:Holliday junction resolvasome RuvABC ATP-dependent DNA helicase subunit